MEAVVNLIRYRDDYPLFQINVERGTQVITLNHTQAVSVRDQLTALLERNAT